MKKFDYTICKNLGSSLYEEFGTHRELNFLKKQGQEGWECFKILRTKENGEFLVTYWFRKELLP